MSLEKLKSAFSNINLPTTGVEKDVVVTPDGFSNVFDHLTVPDFV